MLNRQPEPFTCRQINRELEKIKSLREIADFELYAILGEMVDEGTLVMSVHERSIGDPRIKVGVKKYAVTPGCEPPEPTREEPEEEPIKNRTPQHA